MNKIHVLKCHSEYLDKIISKEKMFEVRLNDRGYEVGDYLILVELDFVAVKIKRSVTVQVNYILHDSFTGVLKGYVIMSISLLFPDHIL